MTLWSSSRPSKRAINIEAVGQITKVGRTSRAMRFEARRVIELEQDPAQPSRARVLKEPVVVCRATGTCVVPIASQRDTSSESL